MYLRACSVADLRNFDWSRSRYGGPAPSSSLDDKDQICDSILFVPSIIDYRQIKKQILKDKIIKKNFFFFWELKPESEPKLAK